MFNTKKITVAIIFSICLTFWMFINDLKYNGVQYYPRFPMAKLATRNKTNKTTIIAEMRHIKSDNVTKSADSNETEINKHKGPSGNSYIKSAEFFTSHKFSEFYIKNKKQTYNLCDKIHVVIKARDQFKNNKTYGGDYFRAKIFDTKVRASEATDGEIVDYNNGTYSAYFTLRWSGSVYINVILVNSAEAIAAINRVRKIKPIRMVYNGIFMKGRSKEVVRCHLELPPNTNICNFTDQQTGEPWFCQKPENNISCSDYKYHRGNTKLGGRETSEMFNKSELGLFRYQKRSLGVKDIFVNVSDNTPFCIKTKSECQLFDNSARVEKKIAAGFYYNDSWYSNDCSLKNIDLKIASSTQCLENKKMFFFGDSTIRQWYEYFVTHINDTKSTPALPSATFKTGPLHAHSVEYNATFFYRSHGFPIRTRSMFVNNMRYAANEIDGISGDKNTIIYLTFFAHFETTSLDVYTRRLRTVKSSLIRLYKRSPKTLIFMKTANTRKYRGAVGAVNMGDWLALEFDIVMRNMMADIPNLTIIDVWDMTTNHRLGDHIHPPEPIIKEYIKSVLSFIC